MIKINIQRDEIIIKTEKLTKIYGSYCAVNNMELIVTRGAIHAFIGPNGAGKSTTIKMLAGAIRPTKGSACIGGKQAGSIAAGKLIGYAPENPRFNKGVTAYRYLIYMSMLCGEGYCNAKRKAAEMLDFFGLTRYAPWDAFKFSAGMRKKLSIAQALIHSPEVLLLDEPTANLDPDSRIELFGYLRDYAGKKGKTILISSHVLAELEHIADHMSIINKGELLLQGEINEIRGYMSKKIYSEEIPLTSKSITEISLEDIYSTAMNEEKL
ncbi:MAG: ABC transporter ATP-binding protein [Eubacteriales bacterium]|nr:ABC transporter ATP-binding protein [Eubacteriales bacterium]